MSSSQKRRSPRLVIGAISVVAIGAAIYLGLRGDDRPAPTLSPPSPPSARAPDVPEGDEALWADMVRVEELMFDFFPTVDQLSFSAMNLELPDERTRSLFWPILTVTDLAPLEEVQPAGWGFSKDAWPIAPTATDKSGTDVRLWRPLLDNVHHFENAAFKMKQGSFIGGDPEQFESTIYFGGLAQMRSGRWSWIRTKQTVRWRPLPGSNPDTAASWRIVDWKMEEASRMDADQLLFRDVLGEAIPDPHQLERARESLHERMAAKAILSLKGDRNWIPPHPFFVYGANDRHPGLAVVDLDRDGFDDLYAMARAGRNQFMHNRGDGTFEEIAGDLGLDLDSYSSSAIFADFDNDGDADAFVGRTLKRSVLFENVDGRFVDRSEDWVNKPLPAMASSVNAVDYDGDGLLDIYVTTYFNENRKTTDKVADLFDKADYLHWWEMMDRLKPIEFFHDAVGPPNVLLRNVGGGRFEVVDDAGPLKAFRQTFQATWADFDADGDPDVYLANDLALDNMIRNDGGGKFTDITDQSGFDELGMAMGVSWGDFDRDGRQDVYVSNMYSTAGGRITEKLPYLSDRFGQMARGNYLFKNDGKGFERVSGRDASSIQVEKTGWSWGSQFADVDNDTYMDLAVLNGFYTAPPEVAMSGDT